MSTGTQTHTQRSDRPVGFDPAGAAILHDLALGLVVADADGAIRYRNEMATTLLPLGDSLEVAWGSARFLEPFDGWPELIERVTGASVTVNLACVWPNSQRRSAIAATLRCTPWPPSPGDGPRGVAILIELTPDAELLEQRFEISQRLVSLGKLAARVAHELNNPLDGILRYVNLALRVADDESEPKLKSYLTESRTGLMRMVQIIGDLLQYTRLTEGAFDEVSIEEVIEQAIKATAAAAEASSVVVAADVHTESLPSVRGSRLYQVCCNLVKNAIDAMPDGGRLTVMATLANDDVVIEVADTGPGLPSDTDRLFEPFFTTKAQGKGSGLGLAICKDFVEEMGGSITAASGVDRGAIFTVRIPVSRCVPGLPPAKASRAVE